MKRKMLLLFLLLSSPFPSSLFLLLLRNMVCTDFGINNADELINLKNSVTRDNTYSGTTVLLSFGIDFSGKTFEPIGLSFNGVFDGQGHVISNLAMTSSSHYVGLFGYSTGLTIKNVVLDSSCSITGTYDSDNPCVAGIIGRCDQSSGPAPLRAA